MPGRARSLPISPLLGSRAAGARRHSEADAAELCEGLSQRSKNDANDAAAICEAFDPNTDIGNLSTERYSCEILHRSIVSTVDCGYSEENNSLS